MIFSDPIYPKRVWLGSDQEIRQSTEERQCYFMSDVIKTMSGLALSCWKVTPGPWLLLGYWDMRTQDIVYITTSIQIALHYNNVRLGDPFSHSKRSNCLHQINPCPAHSNPHDARLHNKTLFQSARRQAKWRLAHCTLTSLWSLVIIWPL